MSLRTASGPKLSGVSIDQSVESLWQEALHQLGPEDKAVITNKTTDKTALLEELLSLAESKRDVCLQKRWKYKRGDDEIIIRDQIDKIIAWVQRFKEVGSTAIQYDPVHAALPWAGVVLVLQIACNDSQTFGAMMDGIESISSLIVRCSVIEQLCLSDGNTSPSQNHLRQALVKLYISIMRYLTKARRYFSKTTLGRMVKSAVSTAEIEVQRYLDVIAKKAQTVHSCFAYVQGEQQIASSSRVRECLEILKKLEEPMIRCSLQIADLYRQLTRDKKMRIMAWLSTINVRKQHNSEATEYLQGSCSWLFQHAELVSWKRSSTSSIVWLHGIPGCGKTKLVYYTISRLLTEAASVQNSAPVLYFYCARNPAEPKRSAPIEIIRSLLKQLAFSHPNGAIRDVVAELFEEKDKVAEQEGCEIEQLTIEECVSTILKILEDQPATIVVDALDEVDPKTRHKVLLALQRIIRDASSLVKVMVSSRDDGDLRGYLSNLPNIYIRADNNAQDIRRFTHHCVQQVLDNGALLNGVMSDDLKANLLEHLDRKAMGMFRWVTVQIDNLCDNRRIKIEQDVREELNCLPETLQASYDQNYERIRQLARPSRLIAERTIKWLMCAQSLMTLEELLPALTFAQENHTLGLSPLAILDTCCNMVVVDNDGLVRFAHLSIREYFEGHDDYRLEDCHSTVLHRCLEAYINTSLDWRFHTYHPTDIEMKPYATLHWPQHFRSGRKPSENDALTMLLEWFLFDEKGPSQVFKDWVEEIMNLEKYTGGTGDKADTIQAIMSTVSSPPSSLFLASYCNSTWMLEKMQTRCIGNWSLLNSKQESAVHVAIKMNCPDALNWLLASELIDPEHMVKALHLAIEKREIDIAKSLIDYGVDGTAMTEERETGLGLAVIHGHYEIAEEILRRSQVSESRGYAALLSMSLCDALQSESHLLFTLLWDALVQTDPPIFFRVLIITQDTLEYCPRVKKETRNKLFGHMINYARDSQVEAVRRITELRDLLGESFNSLSVVNSGALATTSYDIGQSCWRISDPCPLFLKAMNLSEEYNETISILLNLGLTYFGPGWEDDFLYVDVSTLRNLGVGMPHNAWPLLGLDLWNKSPMLLNQILNQGMDANAKTPRGYTALMMIAIVGGSQDCLEILVDRGADMDLVDEEGWTALHWAVNEGHIHIVNSLLDKGAQPDISWRGGLTPLDVAARECEHEILRLLRSKGASRPKSRLCKDGFTILLFEHSRCDMCFTILFEKTPLQHHDGELWRILEPLPSIEGSANTTPPSYDIESIPPELNGMNIINIRSSEDGITPLQLACMTESEMVAKWFIDLGVDVNAVDDQRFSALHYAVFPGSYSIVQLLLHNKADPLLQDLNGRTPLHIAIGAERPFRASSKNRLIKLFIKHMSTLDKSDINGDTALHIAIQKDNFALVKLLLDAGADRNVINKASQSPLDLAKSLDGNVLGLLWDIYDIFSDYHTSLFNMEFTEDDVLGEVAIGLISKWDSNDNTITESDSDALERDYERDGRYWDTEVDYYSSHGVSEFSELGGAGHIPLRPLASNYISSQMR